MKSTIVEEIAVNVIIESNQELFAQILALAQEGKTQIFIERYSEELHSALAKLGYKVRRVGASNTHISWV